MEDNSTLNKYYSVQFAINNNGPTYLFKLRDVSSNGIFILVKEDSAVLKQLNIGDVLNMEYNPPESPNSSESLETQIMSKYPHDSIAGHTLLELSIVEKQSGSL